MPDLSSLQSPEMEYRTRNYWGWLENITPEETVRQIDQMYEAGLGGYVMHARGGLTIPYAGPQWMDSVKAMIRRGKELGMLTIIDDEHGWPSGFGAGKVNGLGEEYQLKYLLCQELPAGEVSPDPCTLGLWTKDFAPVSDPSLLPPDTPLIRVYKKIDPYYVDNMDPKVVDAFIEASYQDYLTKLGSFEGVYAIFSDEPQTARYATPWSDILPGLYESQYGQPLLPQLIKLFYPVPGCERLRVALYRIMQKCFYENYAEKLRAWCESYGVAFTGHTCIEEHLAGQLRCSLGTMPFYEHMTVPGVDWLTRAAVSPLNTLQLTSAAQQTGKKRVLCEMFGCAGWNVSLEEMKWIAQQQAAFGINDHLQHLGLYSLRGSRKREYPASLHYQQPWFSKYRPYNDYFARLCKLLSESRLETDLLVIHPLRSVWARYDGSLESCDGIQKTTDQLLSDLLRLNLSPHLGDETLLARHGHVEGRELVVGQCRYGAVLLPDLSCVSGSTLALLQEFAQGGGRVVCAGDLPRLVDGIPARVDLPCERISLSIDDLRRAFPAPVRAVPEQDIYLTRWSWRGRKFLYIVNNDLHAPAQFRLEAPGFWYEYDPETNFLSSVPIDPTRAHLDGGQALILFEGPAAPVPAPAPHYARSVVLDGPWARASSTANALTLDHCQLSFDGAVWEPPTYILDIQARLLRESKDRDVYLRFAFCSDAAMDALLLVENPEKCSIALNGQPVTTRSVGWRVDKSLEALPVSVRAGENELILRRFFTNPDRVYFVKNHPMHEAESNRVTVETELEAVYLWGDFAVRCDSPAVPGPRRTVALPGQFRLLPLPDSVRADALEQDGFPFFAGTIVLKKVVNLPAVRRARLSFTRPDAIVTGVSVNGVKGKDFCWAPYSADISPFLHPGANEISLELTNSCRNLFGPHYSKEGESYAVGPNSFGKEVPHKQFVRFGVEDVMIEYDEQ